MKIRAEPRGSFILQKIAPAQQPEKGRKSGNNHLIMHQCSGNSSGMFNQQSQSERKDARIDGIQTRRTHKKGRQTQQCSGENLFPGTESSCSGGTDQSSEPPDFRFRRKGEWTCLRIVFLNQVLTL